MFVNAVAAERNDVPNYNLQYKTRIKRHNDKWVWDDNDANINETAAVPDFNVPGRRTSEIKCLEYTWQVQCSSKPSDSLKECTKKLQESAFTKGPFDVTKASDFPYVGSLGWTSSNESWKFKCGSILISPNFVLTAAHCTTDRLRAGSADSAPKIVRFGQERTVNNYIDVNILKYIVHPRYSAPKKYYDIALIQLKETVVFTKDVHPACLWPSADVGVLGTKATLVGRNVITGSEIATPGLKSALVDLVDTETCGRLLENICNRLWCGVQDHQICAGALAGGVGTCQGDSGGPLQIKSGAPSDALAVHYVVGVVSFGSGCARSNTPTICSRVSSFVEWIESIVWN